ncbi:MAG: nitrous oxide reductase family maturation protein NosD [Bacteroidia bacterium]|nr:nitrous oxide reductase family maturation protein NosD [Bacteroidia bacterium]
MYRIFVHILLLLAGLTATGATLTVCPSGCAFKEIKAAVEAAEAGDTLHIKSGLYLEGNILLGKPLTLIGENQPVIDATNMGEILTITADGVTIEGLTLKNVGTSYVEDRAGIRIKKARNFRILNNRLENTFFGIYLEHAQNGTVTGNILTGNAKEEMSSGNGIHLWYCQHITVTHNQVSGHRDGIYLEFVDQSAVRENRSFKNLRYGLHFMFSNDDVYAENEFAENGAGVAVMYSKKIQMLQNHFRENWGAASYGLLLKEIYDAEISCNRFFSNTVGIYVEGSARIEYSNNEFLQNGWAMKIGGGCAQNFITDNNFTANTFDLAVQTKMSENDFGRNYWSEYNGYDLNRNGIGDVPFRPVKLFSFITDRTPEAIVLLRSLFVDLVNFTEKISPVFTPADVFDPTPRMKPIIFS